MVVASSCAAELGAHLVVSSLKATHGPLHAQGKLASLPATFCLGIDRYFYTGLEEPHSRCPKKVDASMSLAGLSLPSSSSAALAT